jgi:16S rRNA (uracil1498-N3)-methyltransferase
MIAALEQSGNSWLPSIYPDATLEHAIAGLAPEGRRIVLHQDGTPVANAGGAAGAGAIILAIGPEGGFDESELAQLGAAAFERVSLAKSTLRFETAGVVAFGHARAALNSVEEVA